jgi:hypothetical protein
MSFGAVTSGNSIFAVPKHDVRERGVPWTDQQSASGRGFNACFALHSRIRNLHASNLAGTRRAQAGITFEETKMKNSALSLMILAGSMLATSAAFAGGGKTMDADGDGIVSASEHAAGAQAKFGKMDANKDGSVTAAEMDAAHAAMGKAKKEGELSSAEKIKAIDSNGDGNLSAEEHSAGSRSMFEKMDTDKNGSLSQAESDAGHKELMTRR